MNESELWLHFHSRVCGIPTQTHNEADLKVFQQFFFFTQFNPWTHSTNIKNKTCGDKLQHIKCNTFVIYLLILIMLYNITLVPIFDF